METLYVAVVIALLAEFWNAWAIRLAAVSSLVLYLVIAVLAGTRRHNACPLRTLVLWVAYQILPKVGTYALGHLTLDSTGGDDDASSSSTASEQVLVAFWAPFLLLHLAGPDNITAYSLEDGKLSWRKVSDALGKVVGGLYVTYKFIYLGNDTGFLRPAAIIMVVLGGAKYIERVVTLVQGNFDNILGSSDDDDKDADKKKHEWSTEFLDQLFSGDNDDEASNNEDAPLIVQSVLQAFVYRAMGDSSVDTSSTIFKAGLKIISSSSPKTLPKVAEMEASLMYDVLYTKAAMIHTWVGYLLRLVSPFCTAIAATLFWLYPKDSEQAADVVITYILLAAAFLLDAVWLCRALASIWTYAYLDSTTSGWIRHAILCSGRWRRLRRFLKTLDLCQDPSSRRMWSGTIGQYNLLAESTRRTNTMDRLCNWLATKVRMQDIWNELQHLGCLYEIPECVKELLFKHIKERCFGTNGVGTYSMEEITTSWGQEAVKRRKKDKFKGIKPEFSCREFQEDILLWHIATTIFLARSDQHLWAQLEFWKGVEVLSQYLMFLVAVRPRMLPGLELRKLFKVTREALKDLWDGNNGHKCNPCPEAAKKKLAEILQKEFGDKKDADANRKLILDADRLARELLMVKDEEMEDLLKLIFDVWVDKMLYAGIRCSKDNHAKQLGRGGELITIVWIVAEHAGPFPIGKRGHDNSGGSAADSGHNNGGGDSPKCKGNKETNPINKGKEKKICHDEDPMEPLCLDICCVKDYCCMEDNYYC